MNLAKINQEWRTILRNIKCKELKNEIEQVEKMCTECIESKNGIIRRLLCDLDESEEIYSTMLHAHMEKIEKIMDIHKDRLQFLQKLYEIEKREIIENYDLEIDHYKSKKFGLQKELECVFYGLAEKSRIDQKRAEEEHMTKKDELKNSVSLRDIAFICRLLLSAGERHYTGRAPKSRTLLSRYPNRYNWLDRDPPSR